MKLVQNIKRKIVDAVGKVGLAVVKRKSPILKEVFDNPESLRVEAVINNDEIIVTIKKRED